MSWTLNELKTRLEAFLSERAAGRATITAARHLTGGASRLTWSIDVEIGGGAQAGKHAIVLRADMGGNIQEEALTREQEFGLLQVAHAAGVRVPRPRWLCTDTSVLGVPFFIMDRVEGESVGRRIVREPALAEARRLLPAQMGEQLALIHALHLPNGLPEPKSGRSPAQTAVENSTHQLQQIDEPHPVLELAIRWLGRHFPASASTVLVHGDFRVGNLMVGPGGLCAIFDWEFAHIGDPAEDLAWPCVRS